MQSNLEKFRVIMDSMTQHEKDEPLVLKSNLDRENSKGSNCHGKGRERVACTIQQKQEDDAWHEGDRRFRKQMQSMMDLDDEDLGMG